MAIAILSLDHYSWLRAFFFFYKSHLSVIVEHKVFYVELCIEDDEWYALNRLYEYGYAATALLFISGLAMPYRQSKTQKLADLVNYVVLMTSTWSNPEGWGSAGDRSHSLQDQCWQIPSKLLWESWLHLIRKKSF